MLSFIITVIFTMLIFGVVCLDTIKKISVLNKNNLIFYLIFAPHIVLLGYLFIMNPQIQSKLIISKWIILTELVLFVLYIWVKLNIIPYRKKQIVSTRLKIMFSGRWLVLYGIYSLIIQLPIYVFGFNLTKSIEVSKNILMIDSIVAATHCIILITNGMIRILLTSRRLNIIKRFIIGVLSFVPVINIIAMLYASHIAAIEYDHECYKVINNKARADSEICKTKYPIVLVHGVGFRDFKYINYWGRIPKELIRNGAKIYYGNQEAWGTTKYNAQEIKNKIFQVLRETGAEKVNIIAHSKGGLDARYAVSKLNMGDYVASLTMISTPHRGCKFVDIACKLPDGVYRAIAKIFDKYYRFIGDKNPDFYTASRQFSTYSSKIFNKEVKDVPQVYYQSYMTVMKGIFSDYVLSIPYILIKLTEGENDGLVSIESAKWGEFRGVLRSEYKRGISHGDIVDLRREDYKGFDVIEKYVAIVSDLKNKGY